MKSMNRRQLVETNLGQIHIFVTFNYTLKSMYFVEFPHHEWDVEYVCAGIQSPVLTQHIRW